jgi:hypothetical protein
MTRRGRVAFLTLAVVGSESVALAWFASEYLGAEEHVPSGPGTLDRPRLLFTLAVDAFVRILMAGASLAAARLR